MGASITHAHKRAAYTSRLLRGVDLSIPASVLSDSFSVDELAIINRFANLLAGLSDLDDYVYWLSYAGVTQQSSPGIHIGKADMDKAICGRPVNLPSARWVRQPGIRGKRICGSCQRVLGDSLIELLKDRENLEDIYAS